MRGGARRAKVSSTSTSLNSYSSPTPWYTITWTPAPTGLSHPPTTPPPHCISQWCDETESGQLGFQSLGPKCSAPTRTIECAPQLPLSSTITHHLHFQRRT